MITPDIEQVKSYYEHKKRELHRKGLLEEEIYTALAGVQHEALAFEVVTELLIQEGLKIEFNLGDFNVLIEDKTGVNCEIDFRLRIEGETLLFGATRFTPNDKDSVKDVQAVSIEIWDVHIDGRKQTDTDSKIVSVQSYPSIIRRKLAVRVAREGKHEFLHDYIYCMFWYPYPYALWPDFIPEDFKFEDPSRDSYFLKEKGFSGICLIGAAPHATQLIDPNKLIIKTHSFKRAQPITKRLMQMLDGKRIDMKNRLIGAV